LNPRLQEAQLEDQRPRKAQEGHLEEEKATKPTKDMKATNQAKMIKKS
jgi:hypothetical protein